MDVENIETLGPWTAHIETMDKALAANDAGESIRAWRRAYSAALSHPSWLGLFTVATASLRVGTLPSLARSAAALARETYWIAFFRARQQGHSPACCVRPRPSPCSAIATPPSDVCASPRRLSRVPATLLRSTGCVSSRTARTNETRAQKRSGAA